MGCVGRSHKGGKAGVAVGTVNLPGLRALFAAGQGGKLVASPRFHTKYQETQK